jgi:hypothetical protein
LGPFQLSTIRKFFEKVAATMETQMLLEQVRLIQQQAEEDGIDV